MVAQQNVKTQATEPTGQNPNVGNPDTGSFFMVTAGPAALAQPLIYEIMEMEREIITMDTKQKVKSVDVQSKEAQGQATMQIASGEAAQAAANWEGAMTIVGAGMSLAATGYGTLKGTGAKKLQSENEAKMKPFQKLEENEGVDVNNEAEAGTLKISKKSGAQKLANDYRNKKFDSFKDAKPEDVKEAIGILKGVSKRNKAGMPVHPDWQGFDYDETSRENRDKLSNFTRENSSLSQRVASREQVWSTVGQASSSMAQGLGKLAGAPLQMDKANYDAAASLNGTSTNMAGSVADQYGKGAMDAAQAQDTEVQLLERIHQTNNMRA